MGSDAGFTLGIAGIGFLKIVGSGLMATTWLIGKREVVSVHGAGYPDDIVFAMALNASRSFSSKPTGQRAIKEK